MRATTAFGVFACVTIPNYTVVVSAGNPNPVANPGLRKLTLRRFAYIPLTTEIDYSLS